MGPRQAPLSGCYFRPLAAGFFHRSHDNDQGAPPRFLRVNSSQCPSQRECWRRSSGPETWGVAGAPDATTAALGWSSGVRVAEQWRQRNGELWRAKPTVDRGEHFDGLLLPYV